MINIPVHAIPLRPFRQPPACSSDIPFSSKIHARNSQSGPSTVKRKDSRDDGLNAEANDDDDDGGPTDKRKAFWGTRCGGDGGPSR